MTARDRAAPSPWYHDLMTTSSRRFLLGLPWLALLGCRARIDYDTPIPDDGTFARGEPSQEQRAHYELAAAWSQERNGLALVVIQGQTIVFEDYAAGYSLEDPVHIFSGTKSFSCSMALAARAEGILDLDAPAADTLEEWSQAGEPYTEITARRLLNFTSGLEQQDWLLTHDGLTSNQRVDDKYALALEGEVATVPGEVFEYGSAHLMAFGALMERLLDRSPLDWLEERILDPLGFRYAGWIHDPSGNPMLPYGCFTTALEWAKYGVFVRDDGVWQGARLLPEGAMSDCWTGTPSMPAYGLTFWLNEDLDENQQERLPSDDIASQGSMYPDGYRDLVVAAGYNDQRLYILPSEDLVVVRLGQHHREWDDTPFLARLLEGRED